MPRPLMRGRGRAAAAQALDLCRHFGRLILEKTAHGRAMWAASRPRRMVKPSALVRHSDRLVDLNRPPEQLRAEARLRRKRMVAAPVRTRPWPVDSRIGDEGRAPA